MNLAETAYDMPTGMLLHEAQRQLAMAEITRDTWQQVLYERGAWFLLLVHAERTHVDPYCAKLAGPCPDGCTGVKVACSDRLHGDCWRVKPPPTAGVDLPDGAKRDA